MRAASRRQETVFGELVGVIREMRADLRELREESRAHTQALLSLIDRLEGGGAAPAGA